jgi:hypothetical protein
MSKASGISPRRRGLEPRCVRLSSFDSCWSRFGAVLLLLPCFLQAVLAVILNILNKFYH